MNIEIKNILLCHLPSPITFLEHISTTNNIFIKRDDMTGLALGGNKARKLSFFMKDAIDKKYDFIITYGSVQSNHCCMTAAACASLGLPCKLILSEPEEKPKYEGNFFLYNLYGAELLFCKVDKVNEQIQNEISILKHQGYKPYFIPGGGHGNLGTHAYVEAYDEIEQQRKEIGVNFDYIFHASGTGTTQAGLIIGAQKHINSTKIIGLSIARKKDRGIFVIKDSILDYSKEHKVQIININTIDSSIYFIDKYIGAGYGYVYPQVLHTIKNIAQKTGILLDPTYTGKAFYGMLDYIDKNNIENKNILFIHTGGIPILLSDTKLFKE